MAAAARRGGAAAALFAVSAAGAQRQIRVSNRCPFPIRVQGTGGAAYSLTCKKDTDCPADLVCDQSVDRPGGKKGGCYFRLPKPEDNGGSMDLQVNASLTMNMPMKTITYLDKKGNLQHQSWNGNVFASTGCKELGGNFTNCQTGICYYNPRSGFGGPGRCEASLGPDGPVTRAEISLQQGAGQNYSSFDFYDVTMIDGVNLPLEISPFQTDTPACPSPLPGFCSYWCGKPGALTASDPALDGCSWRFDADRDEGLGKLGSYVKWVDTDLSGSDGWATGGKPPRPLCDSDADCAADEVCGFLGQTNSADLPMQFAWGRQCGRQIGWMMANGACKWTDAWDKNAQGSDGLDGLPAPFSCKLNAGVDTFQNLYGCVGEYLSSGYKDSASPKTCGCPDWESYGIKAPSAQFNCQPGTTTNGSGSPWVSQGMPFAAVMKRACPTAYSFPFDDASSTFQCRSARDGDNTASYEMTFCPEGRTAYDDAHGYLCDHQAGQCAEVAARTPAAFGTLSECSQACMPPTPPPGPLPVWLCSESLNRCVSAPSGTPFSYPSYSSCMTNACSGGGPAPSTPPPPPPPPAAKVYACAAGQRCVEAATGVSIATCRAACVPSRTA